MSTAISFGLVVYNEAGLIERCLKSIADVAAEIILVHDGPCTDATLDIARRYGAQIFVREREEGSDPHRPFILREAKNDWVFMIDADEFLSPDLAGFLATFDPDTRACAAYAFKWPLWNGTRYVTSTNYRPCLFYRPLAWAIGLHNFSTQTVGAVCRQNYILEHQPKNSKIGVRLVGTTLRQRVERDARQFAKGYKILEKYNEALIPDEFKRWFASFTHFPLYCAGYNSVKHFVGSYKNTWRDGWSAVVLGLQLGLYQYKLAVALWKLKKTSK